jgi:hypothetical protein
MMVRVHVLYDSPSDADRASLLSLGRSLTDSPRSVVVRDGKPNWLVVEFSMPTEAQNRAVSKIAREMRFHHGNHLDSGIEFPKTEEERERNRRKAERRRAQRRSPGAD